MDNPEGPLRDVYVVGVGMTRFGRFPDLSVRSLAEEAVGLALADAGAAHADIETITFANAVQGAMEGAPFIDSHIIKVTEKSFDDFVAGSADKAKIHRILGIK